MEQQPLDWWYLSYLKMLVVFGVSSLMNWGISAHFDKKSSVFSCIFSSLLGKASFNHFMALIFLP